jgi:microcystin-dependent protein
MSDAPLNPRITTYLAPETIPTDYRCRVLRIPNDLRIIAAVSDVLAYLSREEVFEASDDVTEIQMQALMAQMVHEYFEDECSAMVIPVGTINMYGGVTAPDGWLLCDGTVYEKADYSALWGVLGSNYEVASSQFAVPDMRQRSPIGFDVAASLSNYGFMNNPLGEAAHTLTINQMPSHTHIQNSHSHVQDAHTHTQNSHNHVQDAHTHTQNSHNHVQDAHTHTQTAHTHTTQPHTHVQDAHTHVQNSHNHVQDAHVHTQPAHSHPVQKRDNATGFGTGVPASSNGVATTTFNSDNAQPGVNSTTATNQAATAVNQSTAATNQAATLTVDNATAVNQNATATNQAATAVNQSTTATNQAATAVNQSTTATNQAATAVNQSTGGGQAHSNLHPVLVVNFIIKI